ncbi:DUF6491 family protein [Sphingosinicella sp.]|uniref:DUF6491 family protein n=1 Tax=Sphingosinicella sp. TaxID=1917971 RepID=UPI00403825D3
MGMSRAWAIVAILAAGFLLGAPATTATPESGPSAAKQSRPARDCFSARTVNGFRPVGREAVDVTVSRNRQYRLTLVGYCPDVDWSLSVALRTRGGSSFICAGLDAELLVPSPTGLQRCAVTEVRRLSPEEIEAARRIRR